MKDEGGSFGTTIQVGVPNHLKLLWPKAMVVSVKEKAGGKTLSGVSYGDEYKRIAVPVSKPRRKIEELDDVELWPDFLQESAKEGNEKRLEELKEKSEIMETAINQLMEISADEKNDGTI